MIDSATLLPDLQREVRLLENSRHTPFDDLADEDKSDRVDAEHKN